MDELQEKLKEMQERLDQYASIMMVYQTVNTILWGKIPDNEFESIEKVIEQAFERHPYWQPKDDGIYIVKYGDKIEVSKYNGDIGIIKGN